MTANPEKKKKCPVCNRKFTGALPVCSEDGTLLIPDKPDEYIGTTLADKYQIISEIGRGGMSIVYKGRHELMDRTVAIKMLQAQLVSDERSIKRFQQEARAVSCLAHPNVVSVFDFGISPSGQPYLVMDYLVGKSLADVIREENHVEVLRALHIFIQACEALEHAHQKGVIHRDLKSGNIMLVDFEGKKDVVKVVDFGIAKLMPESGKQAQILTATGEIFGSPVYMSPEQCLDHHLDARSDIYSMGAMVYETLTGQPPLMGDTIIDTMQMHVTVIPKPLEEVRPDLEFPLSLSSVVLKALEKKAENRYSSMGQFANTLRHIQLLLGCGQEGQKAQQKPVTLTQDIAESSVTLQNTSSAPVSQWSKPQAETPIDGTTEAGTLRSKQPLTKQGPIKISFEQSNKLRSTPWTPQPVLSSSHGSLRKIESEYNLSPVFAIISIVFLIVLGLLIFVFALGH